MFQDSEWPVATNKELPNVVHNGYPTFYYNKKKIHLLYYGYNIMVLPSYRHKRSPTIKLLISKEFPFLIVGNLGGDAFNFMT